MRIDPKDLLRVQYQCGEIHESTNIESERERERKTEIEWIHIHYVNECSVSNWINWTEIETNKIDHVDFERQTLFDYANVKLVSISLLL